jgi:hypothetical protein
MLIDYTILPYGRDHKLWLQDNIDKQLRYILDKGNKRKRKYARKYNNAIILFQSNMD